MLSRLKSFFNPRQRNALTAPGTHLLGRPRRPRALPYLRPHLSRPPRRRPLPVRLGGRPHRPRARHRLRLLRPLRKRRLPPHRPHRVAAAALSSAGRRRLPHLRRVHRRLSVGAAHDQQRLLRRHRRSPSGRSPPAASIAASPCGPHGSGPYIPPPCSTPSTGSGRPPHHRPLRLDAGARPACTATEVIVAAPLLAQTVPNLQPATCNRQLLLGSSSACSGGSSRSSTHPAPLPPRLRPLDPAAAASQARVPHPCVRRKGAIAGILNRPYPRRPHLPRLPRSLDHPQLAGLPRLHPDAQQPRRGALHGQRPRL